MLVAICSFRTEKTMSLLKGLRVKLGPMPVRPLTGYE